MSTNTIDASVMRKNLADVLDAVRNNKNLVLVKRHGKVESALIDIDTLEDLLATQNPEYVKSIANARKSKDLYTPEDVFGDIWAEV